MNAARLVDFGAKHKLPTILQTEAAECGLACLAMVACHHGLQTDLATIRSKLSVSLKGMNLAQLVESGQTLGLAGRPLRLELHEIDQLQRPCILHWDLNHFVVLKSVSAKHLTIIDPAVGLRKISLVEAARHFSGIALELSPVPDFEAREERQRIRWSDLFGRVIGFKRQLVQIIAISLAMELCALLAPLYVQWTVDHALLSGDKDLLTLLAIGFLLLALAQVSIAGLRSWVILNLSTRISVQWSINVFGHLLRLPQSYFEKRHLGDIVSRFDSIGAIQRTLTSSFIEGIVDGLLAIVTLTMMLLYSGLLSAIVLASVAIYALLRVSAYGPLRRASEEQVVLAAKQQSAFLESARGIQAIKLFGRESQRQILWHNRLIETTNRLLKTQRFMIGYRLAHGALAAVENVLVVWIGAQLILGNVFSIGMLFAFVAYKNVFAGRFSSLVDKAVELKMLDLQGERLADIALTPRELGGPPRALPGLPSEDVSIRNLAFRYSDVDPYVLRHLTLDIPAGRSVAIVGPSGCGKTTLAKLILGLLTPVEGVIAVGGMDIHKLGMGTYRRHVNAVMQDDQLFAGSIADNISFFAEKVDQAQIEWAAQLACIHEDIEKMAMGYNTLVGDMGTALSGGQKQRILLARALYRNPQILVLDEATSHLDVALERAIGQAVRSLSMTRIVIAHRPETVAACDMVVDLTTVNKA